MNKYQHSKDPALTSTIPLQLTLEEAKSLRRGDTLYSLVSRNADGTPQRWRVKGMARTWKRRPDRVTVPIKYGLFAYDLVTERTLQYFTLYEETSR